VNDRCSKIGRSLLGDSDIQSGSLPRQLLARRCHLRSGDAAVDAVRANKSERQQSALMLHRSRRLLVRQHTNVPPAEADRNFAQNTARERKPVSRVRLAFWLPFTYQGS
jgi:hypothetical protein